MNRMIKKIELDLGGKTITLTPEQAKNLKDALDSLFGKQIVKVIEERVVRDSYPWPVAPIRPYYPVWEYQPALHDLVTCGTSLTNSCSFGNDTLKLTC